MDCLYRVVKFREKKKKKSTGMCKFEEQGEEGRGMLSYAHGEEKPRVII